MFFCGNAGGIYGEKASEAIKKLSTGKLLKLAVIFVAYQKTIIIMIASRGLRVVIADKEGYFVLMPDGIYSEKASDVIKKLLTGKLLKLAEICVAYQKTIIIMIASRGLRVFIANKKSCVSVMPDGIYGEKASEAIKKPLTGKLFKLAGICVAYQKTVVIIIASRGLSVVIADKGGCFVAMPDDICSEKAGEAIKKPLTGKLFQLAVICAWLVRKLSSS